MSQARNPGFSYLDRIARLKNGATEMDTPVVTTPITRKVANKAHREPVAQSAHTGLYAEYVLVTPEIARKWLRQNKRNRRLRARVARRLAASMRKGVWHPSNDTLCFDENGVLMNGQHRLTAIIEANQPQEMLVQYGMPEESFMWMDAQERRALADHLQLVGQENYTQTAAIGKRLAFYAKGGLLTKEVARSGQNGAPGTSFWADMEDQLDVAMYYGPVRPAASYMNKRSKHSKFVPGTALGFVHALYSPFWPDVVPFLDRVVTGYGLQQGDPAAAIRKVLERNAVALPHKRFGVEIAIGYLILAANAAFEGKNTQRLQWPSTGFPQPAKDTAAAICEALGWEPHRRSKTTEEPE